MNKHLMILGLVAATTLGQTGTVVAADMSPAMDCSKASAMMADAMHGSMMPSSTGNVDKDFTAMAMANEKANMKLMHIEAMCGKDPKMKAMAAKGESDAEQRMKMFRNMSQSQ